MYVCVYIYIYIYIHTHNRPQVARDLNKQSAQHPLSTVPIKAGRARRARFGDDLSRETGRRRSRNFPTQDSRLSGPSLRGLGVSPGKVRATAETSKSW